MPRGNSGLEGPFSFSDLDAVVTQTSPGVYALGQTADNGTFLISYIGRADHCLKTRLQTYVGGKHPQFKAIYVLTAIAAYEKECQLYHMFGGPEGDLENVLHPDRPDGTYVTCPVCGA